MAETKEKPHKANLDLEEAKKNFNSQINNVRENFNKYLADIIEQINKVSKVSKGEVGTVVKRMHKLEREIINLKSAIEGAHAQMIYRDGYDAGLKDMVILAEEKLVMSLGLKSRDELADHGDKIPSWWSAALIEKYKGTIVPKAYEGFHFLKAQGDSAPSEPDLDDGTDTEE